MVKHEFKILINASPSKIWDVLWGDTSYQQWTSAFAEGSKAETDWNEGSRVIFGDGKGQGMIAIIDKKIPGQYMSFKHIGTLNNGVEDFESAEAKGWAGAKENYTLKTVDGETELMVDMDIMEEYKDYFLKTWPRALDKIKELAEKS